MTPTPLHEALLAAIRPYLLPWRKFTIAVDGVDGSGKSTLARYLAWQLGMPAIETDMFLRGSGDPCDHDIERLSSLIDSRHALNRPVIVEGVFVLDTLQRVGIEADFVIGVVATGRDGSFTWGSNFRAYHAKYSRSSHPDFCFSWVPEDD